MTKAISDDLLLSEEVLAAYDKRRRLIELRGSFRSKEEEEEYLALVEWGEALHQEARKGLKTYRPKEVNGA